MSPCELRQTCTKTQCHSRVRTKNIRVSVDAVFFSCHIDTRCNIHARIKQASDRGVLVLPWVYNVLMKGSYEEHESFRRRHLFSCLCDADYG
eukprot:scaffold3421_cov80-Skeletonema_marinoi.AAC.2